MILYMNVTNIFSSHLFSIFKCNANMPISYLSYYECKKYFHSCIWILQIFISLFIFYLNITNIIYPVYKGYTYFLSAFALYLYVTNISNTHSSCIWMLDISSPLSSCIWILPILSSPSIMCWNITNIPSSHCH